MLISLMNALFQKVQQLLLTNYPVLFKFTEKLALEIGFGPPIPASSMFL